eukprot:6183176-Pleurochrysis_carterae.AAC.6
MSRADSGAICAAQRLPRAWRQGLGARPAAAPSPHAAPRTRSPTRSARLTTQFWRTSSHCEAVCAS